MKITYLEYSAGHEHKFYEVTLDDTLLSIRYGRIGTDGQLQKKNFISAEAAAKEGEKKLNEKRRKGYSDAVMGERDKKTVLGPVLPLPPLLTPYREKLEAIVQLAVKLQMADGESLPWSSKLGGQPYLEQNQSWPSTPSKIPLAFLAQINFSEMPHINDFPKQGILQFFVADDDAIGAEFGTVPLTDIPQNTFHVIYHAKPIHDISKLQLGIPERHWSYLPHDPAQTKLLSGELIHDVMSANDRLFAEVIGIDFLDERDTSDGEMLGDARYEAYTEIFPAMTKFGGYAHFTQDDPRGPEDPYILLFESASDHALDVTWGDMGIANFFIHPDDLRRLDFSRVFYMWDCS